MSERLDVEIVPGTATMFADVLQLWARANAAPTVSDTIPALRRLIGLDERALLIAKVDGEIVGTIIAAWNGWRGSLYRLAVHPEHRCAGVATRLVREAERGLSERGAQRIDAVVNQADDVAMRFWMAAGYQLHEGRARLVKDLCP